MHANHSRENTLIQCASIKQKWAVQLKAHSGLTPIQFLCNPRAIPVHFKPIFMAVRMGAYLLSNGTKVSCCGSAMDRQPRAKATTKTAAIS